MLAAKWEVDAAQQQVKTSLLMESQRASQEASAFCAMLIAAMDAVLQDVAAARGIFGPGQSGVHFQPGILRSTSYSKDGFF